MKPGSGAARPSPLSGLIEGDAESGSMSERGFEGPVRGDEFELSECEGVSAPVGGPVVPSSFLGFPESVSVFGYGANPGS